jgi:hypothetical protein
MMILYNKTTIVMLDPSDNTVSDCTRTCNNSGATTDCRNNKPIQKKWILGTLLLIALIFVLTSIRREQEVVDVLVDGQDHFRGKTVGTSYTVSSIRQKQEGDDHDGPRAKFNDKKDIDEDTPTATVGETLHHDSEEKTLPVVALMMSFPNSVRNQVREVGRMGFGCLW